MCRISLALICVFGSLPVAAESADRRSPGHPLATAETAAFESTCNFTVNFLDNSATASLTTGERTLLTLHVEEAGRRWVAPLQLGGPCNIEVEVGLDPNVATANAASSVSVLVGTTGMRSLYEQGVANELRTGIDPNGATADMELIIGSGYFQDDLWFDPDPALRTASIPANRIDAFSVILHEFGHAIAYNGWADGNGNPPEDFYSVFDRWMLPGSPALFDGPNSVAAWGSQPDLTQNNIKHWGNPDNLLPGPELPAQEILWQDGTPVPLKACNGLHPVHAPPSSESPAGAPPSPSLLDQLMNGVSYYYQYRYYISELDIGLLQDVGLPLHDVVHKDGFEDSAGSP